MKRIFATLLLFPIILLLGYMRNKESVSSDHSTAISEAAPVSIATKLPCQSHIRYRYEFSYYTSGKLLVNNQEKFLEMKVTGELNRFCLSQLPQNIQYLQVQNINIQQNMNLSQKKITNLKQNLKHGVFLRSEAKNSIASSIREYHGSSTIILSDLVSSFFLCFNQQDQDHWQCTEKHTDHQYTSQYQKSDSEIVKTYSYGDINKGLFNEEIRLSIPGYKYIYFTKKQKQNQQTMAFAGTTSIKYTLKDTFNISVNDKNKLLQEFSLAKIPLLHKLTKKMQKSGYEKALGQTTLTQLWQPGLFEKGEHFKKIVGWLLQNPNNADAIKDKLITNQLDAPHKLWVQALAKVGKAEHQKALTELYRNLEDKADKRFTMTALGFVTKPSSESIDFLKEIVASEGLSGMGKNAMYNIGVMSNKPEQEDLYTYIFERLKNASSDQDRIILIQALGNSKHSGLREVLEPYYTHASPKVRAAAIFASRFVPGSFSSLLGFLQSKTYSDSLAASRAVKFFQLKSEKTVAILQKWKDIEFSQVRDQLINTIRAQYKQGVSETVRNHLEQAKAVETDAKISDKIGKITLSH